MGGKAEKLLLHPMVPQWTGCEALEVYIMLYFS
jgi:hypothetical protein